MRKFTIDIRDLPTEGQNLYILVVEDGNPEDMEETYFYDEQEAFDDFRAVQHGKLYKFNGTQEVTIDCEQIA